MRHITTCLGLLAVAGFAPALVAQETVDTPTVTNNYVLLTFEQKYDDLLDVYAPDAVFFDPTGDVSRDAFPKVPYREPNRSSPCRRAGGSPDPGSTLLPPSP